MPNESVYGFAGVLELKFARKADEASYTASTSSTMRKSSPVAFELKVLFPSIDISIVSPAA